MGEGFTSMRGREATQLPPRDAVHNEGDERIGPPVRHSRFRPREIGTELLHRLSY